MGKTRKVSGWLLIIFCSILLVVFSLGLIVAIIEIASNKPLSGNLIIAIVCVIFIGLSIIGLRYGRKRMRKSDIPEEIIEYSGELNIHFTGKIAYKDYRNLILGLSFKNPVYLIFIIVIIPFSLISFFDGASNVFVFDFGHLLFALVVLFFLFYPFLTLIGIKNTYKTNKLFQEQLTYSLDNESIRIKGDAVDTTQKWTRYYKIKETKEFFVLYQDKIVANFLDKKMLTDSELIEFRKFIQSLNVKKE
jgi:hypothetical protein